MDEQINFNVSFYEDGEGFKPIFCLEKYEFEITFVGIMTATYALIAKRKKFFVFYLEN